MLKTPEYYEKRIENTKRTIDRLYKQIASSEALLKSLQQELTTSKEAFKSFKYNVGQAVFNKELGNCLITHKQLKLQQKMYTVLTVDCDTHTVRENTLMPVSQATEILLNDKIVK